MGTGGASAMPGEVGGAAAADIDAMVAGAPVVNSLAERVVVAVEGALRTAAADGV